MVAVLSGIGHHQQVDPTASLLWEAARPVVRPDMVVGAIDAGADAARASALAPAHGLGPMLFRALSAAGRADEASPSLRSETDLWRAQARVLLPRAVALATEPLLADGLEPVIWKGPALAARYPDPALRPMADMDMILPADQHAPAVAALERAGWRAVKPHGGEHYDTGLVHPSLPGLPIELHFGLNSWRHRPNRLRSDGLWARRQPIELFGSKAFGLAPDDEVVALSAHAGKPYHVFSRLIWATDVVVVSDGVDWGAVRDRAETCGCRTVVAVMLRLAAVLGATPPWWVTELPRSGDRRRAIDEVLDVDWPVTVSTEELDEQMHQLQDRLRYALVDGPARAVALLPGDVADAARGRRARRLLGSVRRVGRAWLTR